MKQKIVNFFTKLWLQYKLAQAKRNKVTVVRVWAMYGKESNPAIFNMYDRYENEIKEIEEKLKKL